MPERIDEQLLKDYVEEIKKTFGENLISVIQYGSSVTEEYDPKQSDITILIVLKDKSITEIKKVRPVVMKWQKKKFATPLVLDKEYIESSLDTFPIEFYNMQLQYKVLSGNDVLENLKFDKQHVRVQCERELKGKSLYLRQNYLEIKKVKKDSEYLIQSSLPSFLSIFRALLYLKGKENPKTKKDVFVQTCEEFKLEKDVFLKLIEVRQKTVKLSENELETLVEDYARNIRELSIMVDKIKIK